MNTRRVLALSILLVALLPQGGPARAAVSGVDEASNSFSPKRIEIAANDKVVWTNRSSGTHTVTFDDGTDLHSACDPNALLRVGCQGPGATAERTFRAAGSYQYYCKFHGDQGGAGMSGVVVVLAASTTVTSPASTTTTTKATTSTTTKATSSTTTTTRPLATSSTLVPSSTTTTTSESTSVLLPGDPPPFTDETSSAANKSGGSKGGSDSSTVALIVGLLLAVSAGGGFLLWRLRPSRP